MSLREKIGQLNQRLYGWRTIQRTSRGWRLTDEFRRETERWSGVGAIYGLFRADAWSGRTWDTGVHPHERAEVAELVLDAARNGSPQQIAPLLTEEAPHGHQALGAVTLPTNLAIGAGWSPALLQEAAAEVGQQMATDGAHLALVPTLDVARDPRWGRTEECFGESPRSTALFTRAIVTGMQGDQRSLIGVGGVGVVMKHFAAQGTPAGGRNGGSATIGHRELAEIHLPAAHAGVRAGAVGIMAAYNDIDGIPCCANPWLLTTLLREQWGFDGIVMADGLAIDRLSGMCGADISAAATALRAGVDMSLWDRSYTLLEQAVDMMPTLRRDIDRACRRVLLLKLRFGLVGPPTPHQPGPATDRREAIIARSQALARRSITLVHDPQLRMPMVPTPGQAWLLVGPRAVDAQALRGDYVPPLPPGDEPNLASAFHTVVSAAGAHLEVREGNEPDLAQVAREAAVIVAAIGGTSHRHYGEKFHPTGALERATHADCGEGADLASLTLPPGHIDLLQVLRTASAAPLVTTITAGRGYLLDQAERLSDAIYLLWYPGPHGALAAAEIVTGKRQPTGRLPITIPTHTGALPTTHDLRTPVDGTYVDLPLSIRHGIGSGIGYTRVHLDGVSAHITSSVVELTIKVTLDTTSPSSAPVDSTAFVFVHRVGGLLWPRNQELLSFAPVPPFQGSHSFCIRVAAQDVFIDDPNRALLGIIKSTITVLIDNQTTSIEVHPSAK